MICVLDVTQGPARGRRFWIREHETVQIGRISSADFSVPGDRHMSRHHLILEGSKNKFRVRDVGSANGTFVNDAKVTVIELCNGDRIKAGETIFEVSVLNKDQNPYFEDELTVSAHGSKIAVADGEVAKEGSVQASSHPEFLQADSGESRDDEPSSDDDKLVQFGFVPTETNGLFEQDVKLDQINLDSILKRLEKEYVISGLVNTQALRRYDRELLQKLDREGLVTWHSDDVCSILGCGEPDFYHFLDCLLGQDVLALVAVKERIETSVFKRLATQFSTTSHFSEQVLAGESDLRETLRQFDFAIYEKDRSGLLMLVLSEYL